MICLPDSSSDEDERIRGRPVAEAPPSGHHAGCKFRASLEYVSGRKKELMPAQLWQSANPDLVILPA